MDVAIEEIPIWIKPEYRRLWIRAVNLPVVDATEQQHNLFPVTSKNGINYAIDLTHAHYGHYGETITPWQFYVNTRVREIESDWTYVILDISEATTISGIREKSHVLKQSFSIAVTSVLVNVEGRFEPFAAVWRSAGLDFRQTKTCDQMGPAGLKVFIAWGLANGWSLRRDLKTVDITESGETKGDD